MMESRIEQCCLIKFKSDMCTRQLMNIHHVGAHGEEKN